MAIHKLGENIGIVAQLDEKAALTEKQFVDNFLVKIIAKLKGIPVGLNFLKTFEPGGQTAEWKDLEQGVKASVVIAPADQDKADGPKVKLGGRTFASEQEITAPAKILIWYPGAKTKDASYKEKAPWGFDYHGSEENLEICLIHELIHAHLRVFAKAEKRDLTTDTQEEERVVGLCEHKIRCYTENRFRHYLGYPTRTEYIADKASRIDPSVTAYDWDKLTEVAPDHVYKTVGQRDAKPPPFLAGFKGGFPGLKKMGASSPPAARAKKIPFTVFVHGSDQIDIKLKYEVRSSIEQSRVLPGETDDKGKAMISGFNTETAEIRFPGHTEWSRVVLDKTFKFDNYSYECRRS